jgi:hypothetical protein
VIALLERLLTPRVEGDVEDELGRVGHGRRPDAQAGEVVHSLVGLAKVDHAALTQKQQLVEGVEHVRRRLVDRAQHRALAPRGQALHKHI